MNSLLIIASLIAVAVATPVPSGLVAPGIAGPTPVVGAPIAVGPAIVDVAPISVGPAFVDFESIAVGPAIVDVAPISVGPAFVDFQPIAVGPAIVDVSPISVGPAIVDFEPIAVGPAIVDFTPEEAAVESAPTPLVQIILNINSQTHEISVPLPVAPIAVVNPTVPEVHVPGPVNVVDSIDNIVVPAPVVIGTPALPEVHIPGPVNVVDSVDVEAVVVSTPIIPSPAVALPDTLN